MNGVNDPVVVKPKKAAIQLQTVHMSKKWKKGSIQVLRHIALLLCSLLMAFPFLWMFLSAIKTKDEMWQFPPTFWPVVPQWHHFLEAWNAAPFGLYIFNSVFTAVVIVVIQVVNSAMIAYAFTQLRFKGKNLLFVIILSTYMLPTAATYVPSYILLAKLGVLNSYEGLILSNAVSVFGIFLIRQAFLQVSKEVVEAAKIDGAGHWRMLWQVLFPLTKTSFITFGLISFVQMYNNYLWPSLIIKDDKYYLVTVGLRQFFIQGGAYGIQWPLVMAASTFAVLPLLLLFLVAQKWFVKGISDRGIKG
ncbi:carbohydrate ABC transporter permease [Alkalihalobacterium bogoriense]|uniref:carbohydrate ABC transporter permease n=1 Tax=Alkalihalobacterium bogoriense TaxID=246272 RepID=UPI000A9D780D|nr:carbohydrate ABC transporter permease [Alkalihalobacterium bogoriense]